MTRFSSTDVALEAFRLTRERPRLLLLWGLLTLVVNLINGAILISMAGPALMQLRAVEAASTAPTDPATVLGPLQHLAPAYGVMLVITLIYSALIYGAGNRAVLRPQEQAYGSLAVGRPELLQFLVIVALTVIFFLLYLALFIAVIVLGAVVTVAGSKWLGGLVTFLGAFGALCLFVWIAVRLSLTSAASFDTGRLAIGDSWRLTRGRFWPLFGAYILATVLFAIIGLLAAIIVFALAAAVGGGLSAAGALMNADFSSLARYYTAPMLIQIVIQAFVSALGMAVVVCTPAQAYLDLTQDEAGLASGPTSV